MKVKDAIYLGDTIDDMKAAISAKITPIGILTDEDRGQKQIELLKTNGAHVVLDGVNDILEFL